MQRRDATRRIEETDGSNVDVGQKGCADRDKFDLKLVTAGNDEHFGADDGRHLANSGFEEGKFDRRRLGITGYEIGHFH